MSDITAGHSDESRRPAGQPAPSAPRDGGAFDIYKPGQGYHTRVWTAAAYGCMLLWFAWFIVDKLQTISEDKSTTIIIQAATAVAIILIGGAAGFWVIARNRKACDFFIATEGEMKKVNWTSRKEIIGSTKVVIAVLLMMATLLFVVDLIFMLFFTMIGILKGQEVIESLKGLF